MATIIEKKGSFIQDMADGRITISAKIQMRFFDLESIVSMDITYLISDHFQAWISGLIG